MLEWIYCVRIEIFLLYYIIWEGLEIIFFNKVIRNGLVRKILVFFEKFGFGCYVLVRVNNGRCFY